MKVGFHSSLFKIEKRSEVPECRISKKEYLSNGPHDNYELMGYKGGQQSTRKTAAVHASSLISWFNGG